MRISDWSSDVCSSDLTSVKAGRRTEALTGLGVVPIRHFKLPFAGRFSHNAIPGQGQYRAAALKIQEKPVPGICDKLYKACQNCPGSVRPCALRPPFRRCGRAIRTWHRAEERRVGKEGVMEGRSRW